MCIYVCAYVCVCVHVYVYEYVHVHVYVYVYVYVYTDVYVCTLYLCARMRVVFVLSIYVCVFSIFVIFLCCT